MKAEEELKFNFHAALMMSVKERIKEIEDKIATTQNWQIKSGLMEARDHNNRLLIGLISSTINMSPPSNEFH